MLPQLWRHCRECIYPSHIPRASRPFWIPPWVIINIKMRAEFCTINLGGKWGAAYRQEYQSAGWTRCLLPICIKIEARWKLCRNTSVTMLPLQLRDPSRSTLSFLFFLSIKGWSFYPPKSFSRTVKLALELLIFILLQLPEEGKNSIFFLFIYYIYFLL